MTETTCTSVSFGQNLRATTGDRHVQSLLDELKRDGTTDAGAAAGHNCSTHASPNRKSSGESLPPPVNLIWRVHVDPLPRPRHGELQPARLGLAPDAVDRPR